MNFLTFCLTMSLSMFTVAWSILLLVAFVARVIKSPFRDE
ncbi:hypothetical protein HNQ64_004891 [Prosthecobacter dejongeii]|uniref:Uncharacterized protein n=1 Tax=Prosthecobacter dejongeii TaxID=48465 RepID=A0A7W7YQQ6_9BACT|nr:hypothetical protein [Prosthecobacter dejongeii]